MRLRLLARQRLCAPPPRPGPRRAAAAAASTLAPLAETSSASELPPPLRALLRGAGLTEAQQAAAAEVEPRLAQFPLAGVAARLAYLRFLRDGTATGYGWSDPAESVAAFVARQPACLERPWAAVHLCEHFLAISKPWDVRHDTPRGWPGVERFAAKFEGDGDTAEAWVERALPPTLEPVRFAHQLDFATSGLLLACRSRAAAAAAGRCFAARSAQKTYLAVLLGHAPDEAWTADDAVEPDLTDPAGFRMRAVSSSSLAIAAGAAGAAAGAAAMAGAAAPAAPAKAARTAFVVLRRALCALRGPFFGHPVTLVEARPTTGRRHQIRLHAAQTSGLPVLGDVAYGPDRDSYRMFLHAHTLRLPGLGGGGLGGEAGKEEEGGRAAEPLCLSAPVSPGFAAALM